MFGKLRDAYATLVGSVLDYAKSFQDADRKFRDMHGLDAHDELPVVNVNRIGETAPTTGLAVGETAQPVDESVGREDDVPEPRTARRPRKAA